ncbi:unnamed protein product [Prorocentrum cordatum]|uniref:Uncharacterized protein n=1 Tax=Prorocentrum cordatum TaxID=2364126 RepID=A0ABN9SVL5_9DINO|nr:unnamed protein product [Polarella glacialis]
MLFSCERVCGARDPATDTVRIGLPLGAAESAQARQESPGAEREPVAAAAEQAEQEGARRRLLRRSYPLHRAAELGSGQMEYLLAEGADPSQKNSSGLTAAQVATKKNRGDSHAAALRALGGA